MIVQSEEAPAVAIKVLNSDFSPGQSSLLIPSESVNLGTDLPEKDKTHTHPSADHRKS